MWVVFLAKQEASIRLEERGHFSHGEWVRKGVIEVGVIEL